MIMKYICPLCGKELVLDKKTFCCENRHSFDLAKEGYVNLLPVQQKHSKDPGDNKEMMQARRAFLASDHYSLMRDAVADILDAELKDKTETQLLDLGCGEGYYTQTFAQRLNDAQVYGLDISKVAIRYAAKRYQDVAFCVASGHKLPFADASLDAIVRIYAPSDHAQLLRTLKPEGILVTVTPAGRHLFQLKELVYSDVRLHDNTPEKMDGFTLITQKNLHYRMSLTGVEASYLLQMTPFAWHAKPNVKEALLIKENFRVEADFNIQVYRKA